MLIDRLKVKEIVNTTADAREALSKILALPTVDAEPVVHGQWIKEERFPYYACSVCGQMFSDVEYGYEYCPHCGARMDGDEE